MSYTSHFFPTAIQQYLFDHSVREPSVLAELRAQTLNHFGHSAEMMISPEQGQLIRFMLELIDAHQILEVGTFTGYSALSAALAESTTTIVTCDISTECTTIAREFWEKAGVMHKINLQLGPALTTLDHLLNQNQQDSFDFAFIDADKANYLNYYEKCLQLVRIGGLLMIDNVLWDGRVIDSDNKEKTTLAIRELNDTVYNDPRVSISMLPMSDGITLVRRKY